MKIIEDSIRKETLTIDEYLELGPVLWQRYTEGRVHNKNVKKSLSKLRPEHLEVAIAELTQDVEFMGKIYEKGYRGILNGNTRQYYWKNNLSDNIPSFVYATTYLFDSMEAMRASYYTFDNETAVEKKKEKMYGLLVRVYDFIPKCSKLEKGEILSALNLACNYYDPTLFHQASSNELHSQVAIFIEEIKAFDTICKSPKNWDQALICAALISMKRYGVKNPRLLECFDLIDRRVMDTRQKERDGATHICHEWETKKMFPVKTTGLEALKETTSFAVYWILQYMKNSKLSQLGFNWRETPISLMSELHKDKAVHTNLNNFFNTVE